MRGTRGRSSHRAALALLASLALISSACGSRLNKQERADAIAALTRGGGGTTTGTGGGTTTGSTTGQGTTGATSSGATTGGGSSGGGSSGCGSTSTGGGGTAPGAAVGGCAKATKAGPTGVSADKVKVATLADISGIQPGLFQSAWDGATAAAAYINSTGGICGREVVTDLRDSKTDSGGNRAAMEEACAADFVVAGSMSAFDDGSAQPGQGCGIPDMSAITTNAAKYNATDVFPAYPNAGPRISNTPAKYIAKTYPDAIKHAGIIWLNQAVTKANAAQRMKVWQTVGFKFVYQQEAQVLEPNYTRFVNDMKSAGVQYVTMVADYQNIVRLQKAMKQQGWYPKVRDWDSVVYNSQYFADDPQAVDGSFVFINTAMVEEAASNPEMQLYITWLQRTAPAASPDYFGLYAWSAYRLFQKVATQIGPDLTRSKVISALKAMKTWDDYGLHGPHQIGAKLPTVCNLYLQAKGGKFKRLWPASGFDCSGSLK